MQYEIEIDGRKRQVAVMRVGDRFSVTVDGRTSHVNAARVDAYTLSLLIEPSPNRIPDIGGSREVTIAPDPITRQLTVRVGTMAGAIGGGKTMAGTPRRVRSASSRRCRARSCACSSSPAIPSAPGRGWW
jgi:hypothetical protein